MACQSNMLFLHVHEPWGTSAVTELTKDVWHLHNEWFLANPWRILDPLSQQILSLSKTDEPLR